MMEINIPIALVLGCNTPHGIGVLSDWIEEQTGFQPDFHQSGWNNECYDIYSQFSIGYEYYPNLNDGNGWGDGYGNGGGNGYGDGYECNNYGNNCGDGYGHKNGINSYCGGSYRY